MILHELRCPIVLAPLGGGPSTPGLAASVSSEGGLGFLAAGYRSAEATKAEVDRLRGLTGANVNRFLLEHTKDAPIAYPQVHHLTTPLRAAARERGDAGGFNLWAGQAHTLATERPAATIVRSMDRDARAALAKAAARFA